VFCGLHDGACETCVGFFDGYTVHWDGGDGTFSCSHELSPISPPEIPSALLNACDDRELKTNVNYRRAVFGVMDEVKIVARCPVLQLVAVRVWLWVSPVGMMTIEVSDQNSGVWEHCEGCRTLPRLTWRFIDSGDMEPADSYNIAVLVGDNVSCFGDVTSDVRCPAVFGVQSVVHDVKTLDIETIGFVIICVRLLERDNICFLSNCDVADEFSLGGRQALDVVLQNPLRRTKR
jgi:hypothetical protein